KRRAQPFFYRHPWVFEGAIQRIEGDLGVGDEALLVTDTGEPIARGLFNPHSKIKLRLYRWDHEQPLDDEWLASRIDQAFALRRRLFPQWNATSAARWIASEGDNLSGLTVDRYGDWLTVQFSSAALASRRDAIMSQLNAR